MIPTRPKTNQVGSPGDGNRNENTVNGRGAAGARQRYPGNKDPLMTAHPVLERKATSLPYFQVCFQRWVPRTAPTAVPGYGDVLYGHQGREAHLRAVFDVVSFVEAEVTKVVGRRPFAGSARLWGQGQVGEMVRQGAQAFCDVVEGAVRRGALEEVVVQCLRKGEEKSHRGSEALGRLQNAKRFKI